MVQTNIQLYQTEFKILNIVYDIDIRQTSTMCVCLICIVNKGIVNGQWIRQWLTQLN